MADVNVQREDAVTRSRLVLWKARASCPTFLGAEVCKAKVCTLLLPASCRETRLMSERVTGPSSELWTQAQPGGRSAASGQ